MSVPSLSWQNDRFEYNIAQMSAFFRTELEPADDHLLERRAVRVATGVATNVCGPKCDPCTKRNATLFLNISHVCPEPVLVKRSFLNHQLKWLLKKGVFRTGHGSALTDGYRCLQLVPVAADVTGPQRTWRKRLIKSTKSNACPEPVLVK